MTFPEGIKKLLRDQLFRSAVPGSDLETGYGLRTNLTDEEKACSDCSLGVERNG